MPDFGPASIAKEVEMKKLTLAAGLTIVAGIACAAPTSQPSAEIAAKSDA